MIYEDWRLTDPSSKESYSIPAIIYMKTANKHMGGQLSNLFIGPKGRVIILLKRAVGFYNRPVISHNGERDIRRNFSEF
jgi:hypothetical protein